MSEQQRDLSDIKSVLATDCGSTTTKSILIEYDAANDTYRLIARGEAPTTVEAPFEDVTKGVLNASLEVQELREVIAADLLEQGMGIEPVRRIINEDGEIIIRGPDSPAGEGVDAYISTSSAGGGLQMMVAGVVKTMTAESAERAALGAGAIVMDVMATNDDRPPHEKIERIRQLRPDMILLSGGTDGGTKSHVVELAELIKAARPRPRLGIGYKLPVIYAGNKDAREEIGDTLGDLTELDPVENLRPTLERENLQPARDKIHDLFLEHVMQQAPGYKKLMSWTDAPIMPTPGAVGNLIQRVAGKDDSCVVGVDIGGATTDIFSVFYDPETEKPIFNRTVSANLGMSYSASNVLASAGLENILRWIPFEIDEAELRNAIGNKMIRPTTIPHTLEELKIEQSLAREALRLAFEQHKEFAVGLRGVQKQRTISEAFEQKGSISLVDMMKLNLLVGSGGVLSHAPRRSQSAKMMIDAFLPEGVTELAVDSIFMMPHLGVLASINERAATEVFERDCLIRLGTCVAPVGPIKKKGGPCLRAVVHVPGGDKVEHVIPAGEIVQVPAHFGEPLEVELYPAKGFDAGFGKGTSHNPKLNGGLVGIVFDTRGRRPFELPGDTGERVANLTRWGKAMDEYPE